MLSSGSSDNDNDGFLDDEVRGRCHTERTLAKEEYKSFCDVCKRGKYKPKSYSGATLRLGPDDMKYPIIMGKVETRGEDIKALPPFVSCNLADFIADDGRFDLVGFLGLQQFAYPTLFKLAVKLASIRTNEVGCERFFSTAGYVSNPRRTSLNVKNYECLSTLRSNMQKIYIDESWVVEKYLQLEKTKGWDAVETVDDMNVLNLEREMLAELEGVSTNKLPAVTTVDHELEND